MHGTVHRCTCQLLSMMIVLSLGMACKPAARLASLRGVLKKKQRMRGGLGGMKCNLVYCGALAPCKCQHTWGRRRHGS